MNSFLVNFARSVFGVRGVLASLFIGGSRLLNGDSLRGRPISRSAMRRKGCVVFELVSNRVPNNPRFSVTLRQFGNQNVKRVIDSAALVMHNIIIAANGCPNQAFPWEIWFVTASVAFQFWPGSASLPLSSTQRATTAGGKSLVE